MKRRLYDHQWYFEKNRGVAKGEDPTAPRLHGQVCGNTKGRFREGKYMTTSKMIEKRNWLAIAQLFGPSRETPPEFHDADNRLIGDELVNLDPMDWHSKDTIRLGARIVFPEVSEGDFLRTFGDLANRRAAA
ncbi:hypothetical protein B5K06_33540 [Rhizobium grahamii]|uniref:Uncharacterized protein n=1 Tax=Rhizobium grahamii TaxID=1120045 RepID=A0A370KDQ0_9HYPH|nr:hypothetical protein B5K06_33540 [Rhizobium grahamii]